MYLLDTDICVYAMNDSTPAVLDRMARAGRDEVATTAVTAAELYFGVFHSDRVQQNMARTATFLDAFEVLPFDRAASIEYGRLREGLMRSGRPIGANDMLIAAIALARKATLVTNNTRDFARIPGLNIENWAA